MTGPQLCCASSTMRRPLHYHSGSWSCFGGEAQRGLDLARPVLERHAPRSRVDVGPPLEGLLCFARTSPPVDHLTSLYSVLPLPLPLGCRIALPRSILPRHPLCRTSSTLHYFVLCSNALSGHPWPWLHRSFYLSCPFRSSRCRLGRIARSARRRAHVDGRPGRLGRLAIGREGAFAFSRGRWLRKPGGESRSTHPPPQKTPEVDGDSPHFPDLFPVWVQ